MRRRRFCNTSTTKDICQQKFVCVWRGGGMEGANKENNSSGEIYLENLCVVLNFV